MQIDFLSVLITVCSLVLLMVPGFVLKKTKILPSNADSVLSALCLYGCQPMLMVMSFQKKPYSVDIGINMLIVAGLAILIHFIMIAIMFLAFRTKVDSKKAKINCLRFSSVFSNCGYMGLPFLQALFKGNEAIQGEILIYGGVVIAIFNVLTWSIGTFMMTGDKKQMSFKRAFLNPTVIGIVVGVVLFFAIQKPFAQLAPAGTTGELILTKLSDTFNFLANMVTPLAMLVIGIKLANINLKELFLDAFTYVSCFNKLIVMSIVTMLVVAFLPIAPIAKYALFFALSMPSATNTVMFAVQFGGDSKFATSSVLLSTIISILTIPLMFLVFSQVFGIVV